MQAGDTRLWQQKLFDPDEQVLQVFASVWPNCQVKFGHASWEDHITECLVIHAKQQLRKDKNKRIRIYSQVKEREFDVRNDPITKGILDIIANISLNSEIDELIYECKRLSVTDSNGAWASLATPYVEQGMMRFVSQQYADDAKLGGMLGYVLDGDIARAKQKIHEAVETHRKDLALIPPDIEPLAAVSIFFRFRTRHQRNNAPEIELRHCLLPL